MKYRAIKKNGYGECVSDNIQYIADNVDKWCGAYFDLYIDGVPVNNPQEYLKPYKKRTPITLEEKIVDMCYKIDRLKEIIEEVKETKDEYVCTEEYCGEVGIKTTQFIEKLGQILDKAKEIK